MADRVQFRRDTAAHWSQYNPILLEGEVGYVLDYPNQYKIGDGVHTWNELPLRGFDGTVSQGIGDSETTVMSQKAVTEKLSKLASKDELNTKLSTETYNSDKKTFALKDDIPDTSQFATKNELNEKVGQSVEGMELEYEGETYEAGLGAERFNDYTANAPIGIYSHAEGFGNFASGGYSHAEGCVNRAEEDVAHAEGNGTVAAGIASHAEGIVTHAGGMGGHAEGWGTVTQNDGEHADGKFNRSSAGDTDAEKTRHSVGIGTDGDNRRNAFEIMADGSAYLYGAGGYDGTNAAEANAEGTKAEALQQTLASKVSGTGVASIQVVAELPEAQEDGVLYIVTGEGGA